MKVIFATAFWLLAEYCKSSAALIHQWTFNDGTANDSVGTANAVLHGSAFITNGYLSLNGVGAPNGDGSYAVTPATSDNLSNKTLLVWETLGTKNQSGGSPLSIATPNTNTIYGKEVFDAIDYGERTTNQWMAGSEYFHRSAVNNGGSSDVSLTEHMIAITYSVNNATNVEITIYRDGNFYGTGGVYTLYNFTNEVYLIGRRHFIGVGSPSPYLNGRVDEARVYDDALTAQQIAQVYGQWFANLSIQPTGNTALISWPTNASGFVLQSNPDLSKTNWLVVTNAPAVENEQYQLLVSTTNPASFYRLSDP